MGTILSYKVLSVTVNIEEGEVPIYKVEEPLLTQEEKDILDSMLRKFYVDTTVLDFNHLIKYFSEYDLNQDSYEKILYYIKKKFLYGNLTIPILDPEVEEIECRGYGYPVTLVHRRIERYPRILTNIIPRSEEEVINSIENLANKSDKSISLAKHI